MKIFWGFYLLFITNFFLQFNHFLSLSPMRPLLCNLFHFILASSLVARKYSREFLSSISQDLGLGLLMSIVNNQSGYSESGFSLISSPSNL